LDDQLLDREPIIVAIAGPNGAARPRFSKRSSSLQYCAFINADAIAHALDIDA
jgi:hypothetical protein